MFISAQDLDKWFLGKNFSTEWTSRNIPHWQPVLDALSADPTVLELGTWEGRTAVMLANYLPGSRITCVDGFDFGNEGRFDGNVHEFGERIEKVKSHTIPALHNLIWAGRRYELIYVDASHERDLTLIDALMSWKMLKVGGFMIFDDYGMADTDMEDEEKPKTGIDTFLDLQARHLEVLHKDYQVVIRKISEWVHPAFR